MTTPQGNPADNAQPMPEHKIKAMRERALSQKTDDGYIVTDLGSPILDDGKFTDSFAQVQLTHPDGAQKDGIIRFVGKDVPQGAIEHHKLINRIDPTLMPQILGHSETAIILDTSLIQTGTNNFWDNGFDRLTLNNDLEHLYNQYLQDHTALIIRLAKAGQVIQENGGLESTAGIYPAAGWHAPLNNLAKNPNLAHVTPETTALLEHAASYRNAIEKRIAENGSELLCAGNTQPGLVRYTNAGAMLQSVETNFAQAAYAMRHPNIQPSAHRYKDDLETCLTLTQKFDRRTSINTQATQFNAAGIHVDAADIAAANLLHSARMIIGQAGILGSETQSDLNKAAASTFIKQLTNCYEQSLPAADLNSADPA